MIGRVVLIVLLILWPWIAYAVDIQYLLSNGNVQSVSDNNSIPSITGYGVATIVGHTANEIIWPVPSGCNTGQKEWSRITNPDIVTISGGGMALRTDLVFFKTTSPLLTGCHGVNNWKSLKTLMNQALVAGILESDIGATLNYHNDWHDGRCNDAPTNQTCIDWKAQLTILNTIYPSRAQGLASATQAAILVTETFAFKDAQCKANPGGPFC
jgi:hypothetical protein